MGWLYYCEPERENDRDVGPLREEDLTRRESNYRQMGETDREGRNQLVLPGFAHLIKDKQHTHRQSDRV